jgi:hypothetical protein
LPVNRSGLLTALLTRELIDSKHGGEQLCGSICSVKEPMTFSKLKKTALNQSFRNIDAISGVALRLVKLGAEFVYILHMG